MAAVKKQRGGNLGYGPLGLERRPTTLNYSGYQAARTLSRIDGLSVPVVLSGERVAQYDRNHLVAYSRHFFRNNSIYAGIIKRMVSYVIGRGYRLQARTQDDKWNAAAEKLWTSFWRRPEYRGQMTGQKLEALVCREFLVTGEAWALKTNLGLVQVLEPEQVSGENYTDNGLVKDKFGRVTAFKVKDYDDATGTLPVKSRNIAAGAVCWVNDPERPSCERGTPIGQSVFSLLHRMNDVQDSEALSWQMLSRIVMGILSDAHEDDPAATGVGTGTDDDPTSQLWEMDYAVFWKGKPGEQLQSVERNIPGKDFTASMRMYLRLLGLPFGLPLEIILLDWSQANYSVSKAVLEQAFQVFSDIQDAIRQHFHGPVYLWKIQEWMAAGILPYREDWECHEFLAPQFPWIDQLKEVEAQQKKLAVALASHGEVCKTLHRERAEVVDEICRETVDAINRAKEIEEQTGVKVPWQRFAGLETGKTEGAIQAKAATDDSGAPGKPEKEDGTADDTADEDTDLESEGEE